jgi:hypothetical protein
LSSCVFLAQQDLRVEFPFGDSKPTHPSAHSLTHTLRRAHRWSFALTLCTFRNLQEEEEEEEEEEESFFPYY